MVAATVAVIQNKGLRAASTRDVTSALGVGTGLLNHYFRWPELRALAWAQMFEEISGFLFPADATPPEAIDFYFKYAFAPDATLYWTLWLEALELARDDAAMHAALTAIEKKMTDKMCAVLEAGNAQGNWSLISPQATATRLAALYDGLAGQMKARLGLTAKQAEAHMRKAFELEIA